VSYTPDVTDLGDEPMSDEVKRVADGVLPFNRERMAETREQFENAMHDITVALTANTAPLLRGLRRFQTQLVWMDYLMQGRTRPDGPAQDGPTASRDARLGTAVHDPRLARPFCCAISGLCVPLSRTAPA
jgi:hypothetical protein